MEPYRSSSSACALELSRPVKRDTHCSQWPSSTCLSGTQSMRMNFIACVASSCCTSSAICLYRLMSASNALSGLRAFS